MTKLGNNIDRNFAIFEAVLNGRKLSDPRFRQEYGITQETIRHIFRDIRDRIIADERMRKGSIVIMRHQKLGWLKAAAELKKRLQNGCPYGAM